MGLGAIHRFCNFFLSVYIISNFSRFIPQSSMNDVEELQCRECSTIGLVALYICFQLIKCHQHVQNTEFSARD